MYWLNRGDHAKNFSYLMDKQGGWSLAPGYEITFSSGPNGQQSTIVMGEGRHPKIIDLIKLGQETGLAKALIK